MKTKKKFTWVIILVVLIGGWWMYNKTAKSKNANKTVMEEVKPTRGDINVFITTTGSVQPQNRLEIKPPIEGRVEEILVQEGDNVKKGQIVAWMSSTERAALLDAALPKGEEAIKYWEDAYKPTPLIAPIDGEVIVRSVEPGQTVNSTTPVVVLSDRLIVMAQVDETDIGHIKIGQTAKISLDAYPQENVAATVDHISYESKLVNNVTIYEVEILPQAVPSLFRSGMTANVDIIQESRQNVLRVPPDALRWEKGQTFLSIKANGKGKTQLQEVTAGISDNEYLEIVSGLNEDDVVVIEKKQFAMPKKNAQGNNPFMPAGTGGGQRSGGGGGNRGR